MQEKLEKTLWSRYDSVLKRLCAEGGTFIQLSLSIYEESRAFSDALYVAFYGKQKKLQNSQMI